MCTIKPEQQLEGEIEKLKAENVALRKLISERDKEIVELILNDNKS